MAESLLVRKGGGGGALDYPTESFVVAPGQTVTKNTFVEVVNGTETIKNIPSTPEGSNIPFLNIVHYPLGDNKYLISGQGAGQVAGNVWVYQVTPTQSSIVRVSGSENVDVFNDAFSSVILDEKTVLQVRQNANQQIEARIIKTNNNWASVTQETATVSIGGIIWFSITATKLKTLTPGTFRILLTYIKRETSTTNNYVYARTMTYNGTTISINSESNIGSAVNTFTKPARQPSNRENYINYDSGTNHDYVIDIYNQSVNLARVMIIQINNSNAISSITISTTIPFNVSRFIKIGVNRFALFSSLFSDGSGLYFRFLTIESFSVVNVSPETTTIFGGGTLDWFDAVIPDFKNTNYENTNNNNSGTTTKLLLSLYSSNATRIYKADIAGFRVRNIQEIYTSPNSNGLQTFIITRRNGALIAMPEGQGVPQQIRAREFTFNKTVRLAMGSNIYGLAKTEGTAGQTVEVFVNE